LLSFGEILENIMKFISLLPLSEKERKQLYLQADHVMHNGINPKHKKELEMYFEYLLYMNNSFRFGVINDIQFELSEKLYEIAKCYKIVPSIN
jgi:hypothetical protein